MRTLISFHPLGPPGTRQLAFRTIDSQQQYAKMTLADKDFPSSKAFDEINEVLKDEQTRKEMVKSANAIFAFDLTSPDGNKKVTGSSTTATGR